MSISPGTRLGPYEILSALGAGGMGEVYRARDTKLNRDVALKILPDAFATDSDRLARFRREAQVLASLNHPNIGHIYGFEDSGASHALVLELVEGPTLADRIAQSAIPLDEALPIARQIAEALEAAHEHGIIHRDLKPANIKLRPDGTVKVLDFGLAKALAPDAASATAGDLSQSPTITSPAATRMGMIMGTAAYMSPEQARGKTVDKRADIWAFGCVLYEMLSGKRAFGGDDVTDTIAAVVRAEPDWRKLPSGTPPAIQRLLRRCLEKDRKERVPDIGMARLEIKEALTAPAETAAPTGLVVVPRKGLLTGARFAWSVAIVLLAAAMVPVVIHLREVPAQEAPEVRFEVSSAARFDDGLALSPDGRILAFDGFSQGKWQLWIRPLDSATARPLAGTEGAVYPFWAPDGRSLGFFAEGKLKRIDIAGGPAQTLAGTPDPRGGAWGRGGTIIFAPVITGPLYRVSAAGGEPAEVTRLEAGQISHRFPHFLPDGRHFLYFATAQDNSRAGT